MFVMNMDSILLYPNLANPETKEMNSLCVLPQSGVTF